MRLTVLGSAGTHPGPGRACSGYLVEHDGSRLVLDLGNGALGNLLAVADLAGLDALLLTHLHPDHFADVYGLYYALRFARPAPLRLEAYGPAGAQAHLAQLLPGDRLFAQHLPFAEVTAGDRLAVGDLAVGLAAARHPVATTAVRVEAAGRVLAYSADTAPAAEIVEAARGADVFLCEATWLERDRPLTPGVHCTGAEAGTMAAEAGVHRLVLTHVHPQHDPAEAVAEARARFGGEVLAAGDRQTIEV